MLPKRRHLPALAVLTTGVFVSLTLPRVLQRSVELPPPREPAINAKGGRRPTLTRAPAQGERPFFELGAELSGACLQDRDGFLWVGTFGGGLYRYDAQRLARFSASSGDLSGSNVTALYEDDAGVTWVGSLGGLDRYDKATGRFEAVAKGAPFGGLGAPAGIWDIHPGHDGLLWIGTSGSGLFGFDPATRALTRHGETDGESRSLPNDNVYRIAEASDGRLWLATFGGGVARFDPGSGRVDLALGTPTQALVDILASRPREDEAPSA